MTVISNIFDQPVSQFVRLWRKPYTIVQAKATRWVLTIGVACFIFFLLFTIEIYGMDSFPGFERLYWSGIFSLSELVMMLINFFIIQDIVIRKYTIGNTVLWALWLILCIAFTNFMVTVWIGISDFNISNFLYELTSVIPIGFLVTFMGILIHDRYFLQKKISEIEITYLNVADDDDVPVLFRSEEKNRENDLRVLLSQVLYVQSGGNYVDVFFRRDNRTEHKLIRTKLINLEKAPLHPDLVRCHKSYMVNKQNISSIKSASIRLNVDNTIIPLSDTYRKNFKGQTSISTYKNTYK
jgi:hypothetical protein